MYINRLALLFICIFLLCKGFGQHGLKTEINLLESDFERNYIKDTAYINARNAVLEKYVNLIPDSVLAIANRTLTLARQYNYQAGELQAMIILGIAYSNKRAYEPSIEILENTLTLAKKIRSKSVEYRILNNLGSVFIEVGNYTQAFDKFFTGLKLAEAANDKEMVSAILNNIANIYFFQGNYTDAGNYYRKTLDISFELKDTSVIAIAFNNLGELYLALKDYDKSVFYLEKAIEMGSLVNNIALKLASEITLAKTYTGLDSINKANLLYERVITDARKYGDALYEAEALMGLAANYYKAGNKDEALQLANNGIGIAERIGQKSLIRDGHELLANIQEARGMGMEAMHHQRQFKLYADSLNNFEVERAAALQQASYEYSKKELEFERKTLQQKWLIFSGFAGFLSLAIIALLINRNRRRLNRANHALFETNQQIEKQKTELEDTLAKLTNTQAQLIQAEKMASLGELTSGIAHEIQNPLNFVNNFSEVSVELVDEMLAEFSSGNTEDAYIIAADLKENLNKITHHGKRADGIVKSMLAHSRTSSAKRELTNINQLCTEYANLAFNGFRSKDKGFSAKLELDLDPELLGAKVLPQEIGRVLLNLCNNAFYAVGKRGELKEAGFSPLVKLKTKNFGNEINIIIEDNGTGIKSENLAKVFQPFYTTKPTGVGTGLGLSISYDIITKGHGGQMEVESSLGEFTKFSIMLPLG